MGVLDYIEIIWQKQEKNYDNWSSTSYDLISLRFHFLGFHFFFFLLFNVRQRTKITSRAKSKPKRHVQLCMTLHFHIPVLLFVWQYTEYITYALWNCWISFVIVEFPAEWIYIARLLSLRDLLSVYFYFCSENPRVVPIKKL